ncbi:MAG: FadR family transcriptional regulator [Deltaproteobacteria bacterium]|nr:FadR family transcriptional regulator [Deltaproteobacteria bacterium]
MKRLSEKIVDDIKIKILKGEYQTGERLLAELDLAKYHDVSRSVIRESLRNLESLGLVKIKKGPKGGIFASKSYHKPISDSLKGLVDADKVTKDNVFDIRLLLETHAASQAAVNADIADIKYLKSLLVIPGERRKDAKWLQANRSKLHLGLARASKNPVLEVLMESLIELLREYFKDFHDVDFEQESLISHKMIIKSIEKKNPEKAGSLMKDYIIGMRDFINRNMP